MGKISLAWIFCQMVAWKIGRTNGQNGSTTTISTEAFGVWSIFRFSSYHHLLRAGASRASRPACGSAQAWRRWRHMTRSEEVEEDCCDTIDLNASCVWTSWVHVTLYHVDPPHSLLGGGGSDGGDGGVGGARLLTQPVTHSASSSASDIYSLFYGQKNLL